MTPGAGRKGERLALGSLAALVLITAAWWALALWPVDPAPGDWLARARLVCFNAGSNGLPDASGWLLLIGQPIGMFAVLMAIAGPAVRSGVRSLRHGWAGRAVFYGVPVLLMTGLVLAGIRVVQAGDTSGADTVAELPLTYPRLDRPAPELGLENQHGIRVTLEGLRGRPALVTFAFGHCEAVCPALVHQALAAQRQSEEETGVPPSVVVITLDPWRDTPARLPYLAERWSMGPDAHVLSGSVERVNAVLDEWQIARQRDERTGDIGHPPLVFLMNADGAIAYAASGGVGALRELLRRL